MTREEFDAHVRQIEERFAAHPQALRGRLIWLAALGYAGMLASFAAVILVAALFIVPGLCKPLEDGWWLLLVGGLILTLGGWAVARVLWVRLTPPEGRVVTRAEAPALHAMLNDLRHRLRAAGFHRVVVTSACNAAVSEVPRLGVLGWPRHYLQLGLPLLESLSAEELRAVLAHEFAHLSRRHGWLSGWLYRLRRSWDQIFEKLRQPYVQGAVSMRPLLVKFVDWFWPRFNAHAFVLSRVNEFQADAIAAWAAGPEPMAGALFRIDVYDRLLNERFWPDLWQRANREPLPPTGIFEEMRAALHAGPSVEDGARWREQAFRIVTSNADTHPCLTSRLRAIQRLPEGVAEGAFPPWPPIIEPNAAETLLGPALGAIRADVDARWRKDCEKVWAERHARAASLQHRLQSLSQAVPDPVADVDSLWDQARTVINLENDAAAEQLLRRILGIRPDHPGANFCLGRHLLEIGDDAGEAHLERALEHDEDLVAQACGLLHTHFRRTGRQDRVREIEARLDRHEAALAASQAERVTVTAADTLIPHGLAAEELESLLALLAAEPGIVAAYLGQKEMRHFRKQRLFVLCIEVQRAWHRLPDRDLEQATAKRLFGKARLPGRVLIFGRSGSFAPLAKKLRALPQTQIFTRQGT
jgi:Zn-dependent protease with chaperone function